MYICEEIEEVSLLSTKRSYLHKPVTESCNLCTYDLRYV